MTSLHCLSETFQETSLHQFLHYLSCQTAGSDAEIVLVEPFLAEDVLNDIIIGERIFDGRHSTCRFETDHLACCLVVFLDGVAHDESCHRGGVDGDFSLLSVSKQRMSRISLGMK